MKVAETFEIMQASFRPSAAAGLNATFQWHISGSEGGEWAFKNKPADVRNDSRRY
jgi:hypothetical protein